LKKILRELLRDMSQLDVEALRSLYYYRCLTADQLWSLHILDKNGEENTPILMQQLLDKWEGWGVVEKIDRASPLFGEFNRYAYFLTSIGIEIIRYVFDLPTNIYDAKKQVVRRGYYRASELKIHPKNINHQLALNQFVVDFSKQAVNIVYKYYDEKYVSQFANIRPDGMLTIMDTDFFIEMDMATESRRQLLQKWDNYRNFLLSAEFAYKDRNIVILFIIDGTEKVKERIDLIRHTIYERLADKMDADFDMYIATRQEMLTILTNKLIPSLKFGDQTIQTISPVLAKHQFVLSSGEPLREVMQGATYKYYLRKLDNKQRLIVEDGRIQEFLLDDYRDSPLSVINKILYLDKRNLFFRDKFKRDIGYIVIGSTEAELFHQLKLMEMVNIPYVYFTTISRLESLAFHEALFIFDQLGNVYHFMNVGLQTTVFERTIPN
jgi:hypothetical protein